MKKTLFFLLALPYVLFSQIQKIERPDFHSDGETYFDGRLLYTNTITIQFSQTVMDLPENQTVTLLETVPVQFAALRGKLMQLRTKYGFFKLEKLVPSAKPGDTRRTNKRTGAFVIVPDLSQIFRLKFENPVPIDSVVAELRSIPEIISSRGPILYQTLVSPNDAKYVSGDQWGLSAVSASQAWDVTTGSTNIRIAIIDEGVKQDHQDLNGKFVGGTGGNGEHGTWVAGVAGATTNNSIGVASLGWNTKISNYDWDIVDPVDAIYRAADSADVINISWGSLRNAILGDMPQTCPQPSKWIAPEAITAAVVPYSDSFLQQAINYALQQGVICIAAAGNSTRNATVPSECDPAPVPFIEYPASFSGVIAVSGTKLSQGTELFNDGWNHGGFVDVSAPGVNIWTTDIGGSYYNPEGTSFSAPLVSALAGLILSVNPNITSSQMFTILTQSADKIGQYQYVNGRNDYMGYGRLNAYKALKYTLENYGGTLTQSLTIPSGETWSFQPGVTVSVATGKSITVNGTLNAVGTSPSRITFTKSGGSNWNGIVVGSTGSANIQYANISYAGTGIHVNGASASQTIKYCNITNITNYGIQVSNTTTGTKDISYNTISGPDYCIYVNNASATIHQNTLSSSYSGTGIYSYGASGTKFLTNNIISAYEAVWANNYSTVYLLKTSPSTTGHNETLVGSVTLLADNNSAIEAGGYSSIQGQNSFYGGGIDAQAMALNYSTVVARYNWWNYDLSYWEYNGGTVDMSNALGSDPNGGWSGKIAPAIAAANSTKTDKVTAYATSVSESSLFDESLEAARNSMAAGDYNEAIRLFTKKVKSNDDLKRKKYALARLAECYARAERSGFIDFLNNEVRSDRATTDELYISSMELEGIALIGAQQYVEAAAVYEGIKSNYSSRPETYKHALFNLANLYQSQLGMTQKASECVQQLKTEYPDDALTYHAQVLMGETSQSASAEDIASEQNENTQEQGLALESYPNPFNPSTQIRYSIKDAGYVSLKVYDLLGREVAVLVNGEKQPGAYSVEWNAGGLPSGMYFSRLESGGRAIIQKLLLVR